MQISKIIAATVFSAAALVATSAQAGFITGNVGVSGSFGSLPALPTAIVSTLTAVDVNLASIGPSGGDGSFSSLAGFSPATAFDFVIGTVPVSPLFTAGGFTFTLTSFLSDTSKKLDCSQNTGRQCVDARDFVGVGTVTGAGFDPTAFTVTWTTAGSCNNNGGQCTNATGLSSASWTAQIAAAGAPVPEPGSMVLVALAIGGLVASRKTKKA